MALIHHKSKHHKSKHSTKWEEWTVQLALLVFILCFLCCDNPVQIEMHCWNLCSRFFVEDYVLVIHTDIMYVVSGRTWQGYVDPANANVIGSESRMSDNLVPGLYSSPCHKSPVWSKKFMLRGPWYTSLCIDFKRFPLSSHLLIRPSAWITHAKQFMFVLLIVAM